MSKLLGTSALSTWTRSSAFYLEIGPCKSMQPLLTYFSLPTHILRTPENATLFYDTRNTALTIYDGTKLESPALTTLALLNPNLTSLRLDFCGHLDDAVLNSWSTALPSLTRLELLGPFLVRVPAWVSFFESHSALEALLIHQSPRFDLECMSALATHCPNITELRLQQIGKLDDTFLPHISSFRRLEQLDLSSPAISCSEDGLIGVLLARGAQLTHLDLSGHEELGDDFLQNGICAHAPRLVTLRLDNLHTLTDEGVAEFFRAWTPIALSTLSLARAYDVGANALLALLECVRTTLSVLNICSWRTTTVDALMDIASARELRALDVGWNRAVDDFVIKAILDGCPKLEEIKCWGCNRVTSDCPRKVRYFLFGFSLRTDVWMLVECECRRGRESCICFCIWNELLVIYSYAFIELMLVVWDTLHSLLAA